MNTKNDNLHKNTVEPLRYTDLTYLIKRTKANPRLMAEMISFYLAQTPPLVVAMNQSFKERNWELLDSAIHKMLPSFSIVGINSEFVDMATKIQEYAQTHIHTQELEDMLLQLSNVCNEACAELNKELMILMETKTDDY